MEKRTGHKVRVVLAGVMTVTDTGARRIGKAEVFRDGRVFVTLDSIPLNGKLIMVLPGEFT